MQFLNVQLPAGLVSCFTKNVVANVVVATMQNGKEYRRSVGKVRTVWSLQRAVKSVRLVEALESFFVLVNGSQFSFKMMDSSNNYTRFSECDVLTSYTAQLQKVVFVQEKPVVKKITKPVEGSVKIYKNNVLMQEGYSVNYETGVVTFEEEVLQGQVFASFEFYHHVRFEGNSVAFGFKNNAFEIDLVKIVEIVE